MAATQIMIAGWAFCRHARLLREESFLPQDACPDAARYHSNLVRPFAGGENVALDGGLELVHDHRNDSRGNEVEFKVWAEPARGR